ncbi:MAG: DUF4012 domain-containing protein [Candidatus Daviesbacteria bacterium]|nr:DUF4012 domain-containing protein [Candidatus Daviesbacteria bacterium]
MNITNLNKKLNTLKRADASKRSKKGWKSRLIKSLVILGILFLIVYLPARNIYSSAKKAVIGLNQINAGMKAENLQDIRAGVDTTKASIDSISFSLNFYFYLRIIPFVGGYYGDIKHFAEAASDEMQAAQIIIKELEPYKNELGFTGQSTAGQDRIAQVVKVLDKTLPAIDKFEPYMKKARNEVSSIDVNKYPETIGGRMLKNRIDEAKNFIVGAHIAVTDARPVLEVAPSVLGEPSAKTYLMLFQNDKELRATGGFLTAYTFLKLDRGHLTTTQSDDIYRLDERLLKVCLNKVCPLTPPAPIVRYLPEVTGKPRTAWSMRDSNLSPDLPTSVKDFERMYAMVDSANAYNGIITIDTNVVEELIKITGPIEVNGTKYSAEIDKRCNCANVIYELEHYAEVASKGEADRKEVVGTLMQSILAKLLGSGIDKIPTFINVGVKLANDKHIMMYMDDQKAQQAFAQLNWTGEIKKDVLGDYLHINDSNFAGGKSNLYVTEKVTLEIKVNGDGSVKNKVTIDYKNPQPFSLWLNGINRSYVRIYAPRGSKLTYSKGSDDPVNEVDDEVLNKTYFEGFVQVRPQNSRTLVLEYTLPFKVTDKKYPLLIQKQPGTKDYHYTVKINGVTKADLDLNTDKTLNLTY